MSFARATALRLDQASATVLYVGYAIPGTADADATWSIKRLTTTGNIVDIKYSGGGSSAFNSIWNDRATTSYA